MADQLARKDFCPLLNAPCMRLDCKWYLQLAGTDPQDPTKNIDGWDCAIVWLVQSSLDVRKSVEGGLNGVQQATESFRNAHAEASMTALRTTAVLLSSASRPHKMIE